MDITFPLALEHVAAAPQVEDSVGNDSLTGCDLGGKEI